MIMRKTASPRFFLAGHAILYFVFPMIGTTLALLNGCGPRIEEFSVTGISRFFTDCLRHTNLLDFPFLLFASTTALFLIAIDSVKHTTPFFTKRFSAPLTWPVWAFFTLVVVAVIGLFLEGQRANDAALKLTPDMLFASMIGFGLIALFLTAFFIRHKVYFPDFLWNAGKSFGAVMVYSITFIIWSFFHYPHKGELFIGSQLLIGFILAILLTLPLTGLFFLTDTMLNRIFLLFHPTLPSDIMGDVEDKA